VKLLVGTKRWFVLGLALLAAVMSAFGWVIGSPNGSSPDDNYHLASIWCPTPLGEHCEVIGTDANGNIGVLAPESLVSAACNAYHPELSAACQLGLSDTKLIPYHHIDNGEYPGGYYDFLHLFAGDTADATVLATRWVNVCIAIIVWGVLFWLLPFGARRLMGYCLAASAIPLSVFLIPSNNPSGWAIVGVSSCWLAWHGAANVSEPWRQRALAGVGLLGAVLAATARSDAGAYIVLVTGIAGFLHWPELAAHRVSDSDKISASKIGGRRSFNWLLLGAMGVAILIGLIAYLSGSQTSALASGLYNSDGRNPLGVLGWNLLNWPAWWVTLWSAPLGWLDTATPSFVWMPATFIAFGLLFAGLRYTAWRKNLAAAALLAAMIVLPLAVMQAGLTYWADGGVQVRYILPLLPVLFAVLLMRPDRQGMLQMSLTQDVLIWAGLGVAHALTLYNLIRRHTVGLAAGAPLNINAAPQWWRPDAPSPLLTWGISSLGFVLLLGLFLVWSRKTVQFRTGQRQLLSESAHVFLQVGHGGRQLHTNHQQEEDGGGEQQIGG
jgi:hypothetical protein